MNQKYKIFINNKIVFLTNNPACVEEVLNKNYSFIIDGYKNEAGLKKWLEVLLGNENHSSLVLFHSDIEKLKTAFFNLFTIIEAAGGLVFNQHNQILLIFRRGFWDLPKGKIEKGESITTAAVREVEEETGISKPMILRGIRFKDLLNEGTYHVYLEKGKIILKISHWFLMSLDEGSVDLTPQTNEDIEQAIWVDKNEVSKYYNGMYSSIVEVLQNIESR